LLAPRHFRVEPEIDWPRGSGKNVPVRPLRPNVIIDPELEKAMRGAAIEAIQSMLTRNPDGERAE
jgi:hypothetical protein